MQKIKVDAEITVADNSAVLVHTWSCELAEYLSKGSGIGKRSVSCSLLSFPLH